MGSIIDSSKTLVLDGVEYQIDDLQKTYCKVPEDGDSSDSATNVKGLFEGVTEVQTKNELIGTDIYVADWFIYKNGSRLGLYTKNGKVDYMAMVYDVGGTPYSILMEMNIEGDISKADFSIPQGYVLVDYESFQSGSVI